MFVLRLEAGLAFLQQSSGTDWFKKKIEYFVNSPFKYAYSSILAFMLVMSKSKHSICFTSKLGWAYLSDQGSFKTQEET